MKPKLLLGLLLVTVATAVVSYFAVTTLGMNQSVSNIMASSQYRPAFGQNNSDFISQNYPWHLITPTWIQQGDLSLMIEHWLKLEEAARLGLIFFLWLLISGLIIWRHRKNRS